MSHQKRRIIRGSIEPVEGTIYMKDHAGVLDLGDYTPKLAVVLGDATPTFVAATWATAPTQDTASGIWTGIAVTSAALTFSTANYPEQRYQLKGQVTGLPGGESPIVVCAEIEITA